ARVEQFGADRRRRTYATFIALRRQLRKTGDGGLPATKYARAIAGSPSDRQCLSLNFCSRPGADSAGQILTLVRQAAPQQSPGSFEALGEPAVDGQENQTCARWLCFFREIWPSPPRERPAAPAPSAISGSSGVGENPSRADGAESALIADNIIRRCPTMTTPRGPSGLQPYAVFGDPEGLTLACSRAPRRCAGSPDKSDRATPPPRRARGCRRDWAATYPPPSPRHVRRPPGYPCRRLPRTCSSSRECQSWSNPARVKPSALA